jgi:hypothetical protein
MELPLLITHHKVPDVNDPVARVSRLGLDPEFSRIPFTGAETFQFFKHNLHAVGMVAIQDIAAYLS